MQHKDNNYWSLGLTLGYGRIGHVSRWPLMSRSAKPVASWVWNSSADCDNPMRMSACGPRPPMSQFSSNTKSNQTTQFVFSALAVPCRMAISARRVPTSSVRRRDFPIRVV
jgi:hypothetical protein